MFEIKMTREEIIEGLKANFGSEFTAADVRGFCRMNDIAYQTVTKKIKEFNVGRGKWNLEVTQKVVEDIEKSFNPLDTKLIISFLLSFGWINEGSLISSSICDWYFDNLKKRFSSFFHSKVF